MQKVGAKTPRNEASAVTRGSLLREGALKARPEDSDLFRAEVCVETDAITAKLLCCVERQVGGVDGCGRVPGARFEDYAADRGVDRDRLFADHDLRLLHLLAELPADAVQVILILDTRQQQAKLVAAPARQDVVGAEAR